MRRALILFVAALLPASAGLAALLQRDLGQGLAYYRLHELPGDLPTGATGPAGACVVDVRYVHADERAAIAFQAWLKFRGSTRAPIFLLANAATAVPILSVLADRESAGGIMVIGAAAGNLRPDLAVTIAAADERRAYDALEEGATLAALLQENPDKIRNDEASLAKDRAADTGVDAPGESGSRPKPPPIDAALQRAVQVYRALLALKKI